MLSIRDGTNWKARKHSDRDWVLIQKKKKKTQL